MTPPLATPASALPARPERPVKYAQPVPASDGSIGYDHPLENYFDASMAARILPPVPPTRLYDTIARAHDHRFDLTQDIVDPSWTTPRPLVLNPRERHRSLAKTPPNAPDYMGISPDVPGWRPRRSSYEDRRGAVGVTPSEVNTLVPYIPPIDTSLPPPSREWLDAMAKRILADAHAEFDHSHRIPSLDSATDAGPPISSDDTAFVDYDTDTTVDDPMTLSRLPVSQPPHPAHVERENDPHDRDFNWSTDTDTDADTDIDVHSEYGYNWSTTRISESSPLALSDVPRWIIPRKRPSVVITDNQVTDEGQNSTDASRGSGPGPGDASLSSEEEAVGKRRRGKKGKPLKRAGKKPKRHADDTPTRRGGMIVHNTSDSEGDGPSQRASAPPHLAPTSSLGNGTTSSHPSVSSITATALQMKQIQIASPRAASPQILPQAHTSTSVPPRSPKVFACLLDGCTQICASLGDLQRHQQSLRHSSPSHNCLACGKSYTRLDALKRHLNSKASCKKVHATKLADHTEVEEVEAEANQEAV